MYYYIPKSQWGNNADQKMVATIEQLLVLCKAGEVSRVIIPMTYYGYGASLMDESNRRSIKRDYAQNRFKDVQYSLTVSGYQFAKHEWIRELIENLLEQYTCYDEQDYSQLEFETITEFVIDELYYWMRGDALEQFLDVEDERAEIQRVLFDGDWKTQIEYWEYAHIDNDGLTPYMQDNEFETLKQLFLAKRDAMKADKE